MRNVQDDLEIKKLKLHYNFAKFAMWGTLIGLLMVLIMMLAVIVVDIAFGKTILQGRHIVIMFTISIGGALGFGAYIWGRSLTFGKTIKI